MPSEKTYTADQIRSAIAEAKRRLADEVDVELHSAEEEGQDLNIGCLVIEI